MTAEPVSRATVNVTVNAERHTAEVPTRLLLVHFLRETLGMTGTHIGCDTSNCGACTVLLDGKAVKSCTLLAVQVDGCSIETVEGLEQNGTLHPLQEGFLQEHGLQCGFCTPGMLMSARALLAENAAPTEKSADRGKKFQSYRSLESLRDYVLVAQDKIHVEHWTRQPNREWTKAEFRNREDTISFSSIEVALPLSEIYLKVDLSA